MTTTRKAAPKGAAARSGMNGHFKTIPFKGLKLHLPAKVKLRMLKQLSEGTQEEMIAVMEELLGEQMEQVWELDVDISQGLDALGEFLGELALKVFDSYGSSGESQASSPR